MARDLARILRAAQLRPATVESYERLARLNIVPHIGRIPVARLSQDDVARMMASLAEQPGARGRPLSARTLTYTLSILRIALNRAVEASVVTRNVARLVRPPKQEKAERQPFTPEQVAALIAETRGSVIGPLLIVSATTGIRQGEALALRWEDLDLEAGVLTVAHTLDPRTQQLAPTKTERSRRTIHLPAVAVAALRDQQQRQRYDRLQAGRRWHDEGYVFATTLGTAQDARNATRRYHAACERLGLPNVPWHHLRHFAATALLEAGDDLFVVSRILGHTSVATTAGFYGHVQPAMLRRSADRMDEVMRRASGT